MANPDTQNFVNLLPDIIGVTTIGSTQNVNAVHSKQLCSYGDAYVYGNLYVYGSVKIPSGGSIIISPNVYDVFGVSVITTNNTPTTLITIPTSASNGYTIEIVISCIDVTATNSGSITMQLRG